MFVRQEQRAHELAAFKQRTQKIIESFEVKNPSSVPETASPTSMLDNYSIDLSISNVGVAFPLKDEEQLDLSRYGSHDNHVVRAFLFSISSIQFGTVRGVTGKAAMKRLSFQFVNRCVPFVFIENELLPTMTKVQTIRSSRLLRGNSSNSKPPGLS